MLEVPSSSGNANAARTPMSTASRAKTGHRSRGSAKVAQVRDQYGRPGRGGGHSRALAQGVLQVLDGVGQWSRGVGGDALATRSPW